MIHSFRHLLPPLLLSLVCGIETRSQDFYPLDSANTWNYRVFHSNYPQPPDSATRQLSVEADTLMPNGRVYRRLSHPDPLGALFVRLDSTHVFYYNGADVPIFDLRDTAGTVDTIWWEGLFTSRLAMVGTAEVFGQSRTARYYTFDGLVQAEASLVDGFGIVDAVDWGDGGWPFDYAAWWRIRGCIIRDTTYGTVLDAPAEHTVAAGIVLHQNYPNPFNPKTEVKFQIAELGMVTIKIYDLLGREVATLVTR